MKVKGQTWQRGGETPSDFAGDSLCRGWPVASGMEAMIQAEHV